MHEYLIINFQCPCVNYCCWDLKQPLFSKNWLYFRL